MKTVTRTFLYLLGLFMITVGINLSIISGLGVSPVSAFIAPLSEVLRISLGTLTTFIYALFVLIQMILLQRNFKLKNLLQLPFSFVFGIFVDFGGLMMSHLHFSDYATRLIVLLLSIVICAIGACLYITMDFVPNPPEGLLLAICEKYNCPFSKIKIISDCLFVATGIIITLLSSNEVWLIREGTLIAMLMTGPLIGLVSNKIARTLKRVAFDDSKILNSN